jgi:hypothetical protein
MSGKYMRTRKIVMSTMTLLIIASQLMGCGVANSTDAANKYLQNVGTEIEIEVSEPDMDIVETNVTQEWTELASLTTAPDLRNGWDDTLLITGTTGNKNGMLYVNADGEQDNNNTLRTALHNRAFTNQLDDKACSVSLAQSVLSQYTDTDDMDINDEADVEKLISIGINAYFNLLPDASDSEADADNTLSRLEFMSMVYRAETPVTDGIAPTEEFTVQIGATNTDTDPNTNTALNLSAYVEQIQSDAYLNTSDKSLNNSTSTGKITRGEVIYLLMNHYFKEEMQSVDLSDKELPEFSDAKLETKALKNAISSISSNDDYYNSSKLGLSISEPDTYGVPEEIYKAMVLANQKGFITEDTEYDNAITKEDAISLIVEVLRAERGIGTFNYTNGITTTATADTDYDSQIQAELDRMNEDLENLDWDSLPETVLDKGLQVPDEYMTDEEEGTEDYTVEDLNTTMTATQNARVRKGPSSSFEVIGTISQGDEIKVTGKVKEVNWYKVEVNGEEGYVSGNSLKEKEVTTTKKDTTPAKKDTTPSTETPSTDTPTPDTTPSTETPSTSPDGSNDGYQPDGTYIDPVDGSVVHPGDTGVSSDGSDWYFGTDADDANFH